MSNLVTSPLKLTTSCHFSHMLKSSVPQDWINTTDNNGHCIFLCCSHVQCSHLIIKSWISLNFNFELPDEILTIVTEQLFGQHDNKINALISLLKVISTELNWLIIILNSLMWYVTDAPSPIFRLNNLPIKYNLFKANDFSSCLTTSSLTYCGFFINNIECNISCQS